MKFVWCGVELIGLIMKDGLFIVFWNMDEMMMEMVVLFRIFMFCIVKMVVMNVF